MKSYLLLGLATGIALLSATEAGAQFIPGGAPFRRPTVSPYLNLVRSGSNPAINYYGIVRPEFMAINAFQNLNTSVNRLATNQTQIQDTLQSQTGHVSAFMTQSSYFMTYGVGPQRSQTPGTGSQQGTSGTKAPRTR